MVASFTGIHCNVVLNTDSSPLQTGSSLPFWTKTWTWDPG